MNVSRGSKIGLRTIALVYLFVLLVVPIGCDPDSNVRERNRPVSRIDHDTGSDLRAESFADHRGDRGPDQRRVRCGHRTRSCPWSVPGPRSSAVGGRPALRSLARRPSVCP